MLEKDDYNQKVGEFGPIKKVKVASVFPKE